MYGIYVHGWPSVDCWGRMMLTTTSHHPHSVLMVVNERQFVCQTAWLGIDRAYSFYSLCGSI